jgi:hypothetical protein
LLDDDGQCWQGFDTPACRARWLDQQAATCTFAMLEEQTRRDHWGGGLECGKLSVACAGGDGAELRYRYEGEATWRRRFVGIFSSQSPVTGTIRLTTDAFGRVRGCELDADQKDLPALGKTPIAAVDF